MHCANCGTQLGEQAKFCGVCGTPVPEAAAQAAIAPAQVAAPPAAPQQQTYQAQPVANNAYAPQGQQPYTAQGQQPYGSTVNVNVATTAQLVEKTYPRSDSDKTLCLIAFILNVITCVCLCWTIIPLAWLIPMTVHTWGIYQGKKPNTVVFGVCTLIFCDIISGILLLVAQKDE